MRRSRPEKPRSASFTNGLLLGDSQSRYEGTLFVVSRRLPFALPSSDSCPACDAGKLLDHHQEQDGAAPPSLFAPPPPSPMRPPTTTECSCEPAGETDNGASFEIVGGLNVYKAAAVRNRFARVVWVGLVSEEQATLWHERIEAHNAARPQEQCLAVAVPRSTFDAFYSFCKEVLWKMFHYSMPEQFQATRWKAYCEVNRLLASAVLQRARAYDTVWAHDYHLLMLPEMLRTGARHPLRSLRSSSSSSLPTPPTTPTRAADEERTCDGTIFGDDDDGLDDFGVGERPTLLSLPDYDVLKLRVGLFLHSPFPTSEIFRCLPVRRRLLFGLLHSDLVGFQTFDYARHFMRSCFRILGADQDIEGSPASISWGDRRTSIGVIPIGIDPERFQPTTVQPGSAEEARERQIAAIVASYEERYRGLRVIFGKDSLEDTKGIPHKLRAFERLLAEHPEWIGRLVYLQVTYPPSNPGGPDGPSAGSLTAAQEALLADINDLTTKINSRFGSLFYQPAQHIFKQPSLVELTALYRVADVAFLLPLRDGMNLTAHEFSVAASFHKRSPIVLSEFAGSARILPGAFLCNPFNTMQVSNALHAALNMGDEQKDAAHVRLTSFIHSHTASNWGQRFLYALYTASHESSLKTAAQPLDRDLLAAAYRAAAARQRARRRVFFLDYDGTLTPIVARPELAVPSPATLHALTALAADPDNLVIVISGRDCSTLENWLGAVPGLLLSAEHGAFVRRGPAAGWEAGYVHDVDLSWQPAVEAVLQHYVSRTPGSWIERKRNNLVWHYRASDPAFAAYQAKELVVQLRETIVSKLPVEVLSGKKAVEIRPAGIHKGTIVKNLLGEEDWGFAVAIGDDKTDEDMFNALPITSDCFSIFVGTSHSTSAQYYLSTPDDVLALLTSLVP